MTGEGSISFANGAFKRYYSLDGKRVLGQTFMPTLLDDDISKFTNFLAALTPYNPMGMVQYRVQLKEEIRWQQWTYRMIYDQNGLLREIQGVGRDITEQKRIEDEILRSDKLESLGMLAGGMAHEFNNVLTKVLGNITLAKTMVQPNDPLFKRLDNTERSIYDAKRLTDSILTFSDGGEPIKETLSVRDLLYDSSSTAVIGTNVSPKFDLQDDLFNIEADHSQMIQAMRAIFSNAVESMPNGGNVKVVARNVELETNENGLDLFPGSYVRIDIIDHGVGIPKEKLLHIFDPYFTTKGSGGLGLTTALSIVKRHKGNILVESAVSLGSKFGIFLPATLNEIRSDERAEVTRDMEIGRVLLMDDEEGILEVGKELLQEYGYEVECARTGEEAVKMYDDALKAKRRFDIIIMDLTIKGGMGGREAIRKVLDIDPAARAIVSSGYSHDPVMAHYYEYGFKGVVKKPYMIADMIDEIQRIIKGP
jgi:two-component system cell cycle sensor histidine kinase/response regulator CckA